MNWVFQSLGLSKQAYYQQLKRDKARSIEKDKIIQWVIEYRKLLPKTGTRKLYQYLQLKMIQENIKMGRDAINILLRSRGMLIKKQSDISLQPILNISFTNHLTY